MSGNRFRVVSLVALVAIACGCRAPLRGESAKIRTAKEYFLNDNAVRGQCRAYQSVAEFDAVNPNCCTVRSKTEVATNWDGRLLKSSAGTDIVLLRFECRSVEPMPGHFAVAEVEVDTFGKVRDLAIYNDQTRK